MMDTCDTTNLRGHARELLFDSNNRDGNRLDNAVEFIDKLGMQRMHEHPPSTER